MSEEDRVFARFRGKKPIAGGKRETLNVPRRGATGGSRVVEVVHVRGAGGAKPRPPAASRRAETWQDGFQARPAPKLPEAPPPAPAETPAPTVHVMPMWAPAPQPPAQPPPAEPPSRPVRAPRAARRPAGLRPTGRRVADPFDMADEGANCLRCGYLVEPARERRGLHTCAACG